MKARLSFVVVAIIVFSSFAFTQQRLLVVGGGARPAEAMKKFVEWSGGQKSQILVITWASGVPEESFVSLQKQFTESGSSSVVHAATRPLDSEKKVQFIKQLNAATGVFFSGGDQNRTMDVLADVELLKLIREKYTNGTPFGGTSAGAAVMSDPTMTGDADLKILDGKKVGVRGGLGLIPKLMFDQHFLVRQRHNRLFGFIIENPKYLGVGIDEDTAVLIEDNRHFTVAGASQVMFVNSIGSSGSMKVDFLKVGEVFDLKKRKKITASKNY